MAACGHTRRPTLHWFCTAGTDSAKACTDHCTQLLEGIYTNLRDECRGMSDAPPLRNSATCLEAGQRQIPRRAAPGRPVSADVGSVVVLLGQTGFGSHGRCDEDSTGKILAARDTELGLPPGAALYGFSNAYWTWGGSNNKLVQQQGPTEGVTVGRHICVRAMARRGPGNALPHPPAAQGTHRLRTTSDRRPGPVSPACSPVTTLELSAGGVRSPGCHRSRCGRACALTAESVPRLRWPRRPLVTHARPRNCPQELASPSSMGGMVEVGEGAYNSLEDKWLSTVKRAPWVASGRRLSAH